MRAPDQHDGQQPVLPLRQRPWFVMLMLLVLPPVGLVLFWRNDLWPYQVKWLVTAVMLASVIYALGKLP
jgi:hypothetical protein